MNGERATCELCNKREGAYSHGRRLFVCNACWDALGAQEKRYDAAIAAQYDLTGQDAEAQGGAE